MFCTDEYNLRNPTNNNVSSQPSDWDKIRQKQSLESNGFDSTPAEVNVKRNKYGDIME
jgi:hypothetical protein